MKNRIVYVYSIAVFNEFHTMCYKESKYLYSSMIEKKSLHMKQFFSLCSEDLSTKIKKNTTIEVVQNMPTKICKLIIATSHRLLIWPVWVQFSKKALLILQTVCFISLLWPIHYHQQIENDQWKL